MARGSCTSVAATAVATTANAKAHCVFCSTSGRVLGRPKRWARHSETRRRPTRPQVARPLKSWVPRVGPRGARVALFSQIMDCAGIIESFVRHYAALGLFKLLLYLDDPNDVVREVLEGSGWVEAGFVEITIVNDHLRGEWLSLPSWRRVGQFAGMEVQSRQILNNEHALVRARELGADWLLHVDSDELLILPKPAPAFFASLSACGCTMYTFDNVEGVPQTGDSVDVLQSVRLFRQNKGRLPRNPRTGAIYFNWQLKLGGYFISYENGKTAVSVRHAVQCLSVCLWDFEPKLEPGKSQMPDGSTCTWFTNSLRFYEAAVAKRKEGGLGNREEVPRYDDCRDAILLHFCVCDFATFWRKRWTQLGYLSASDQFRVRTTSGAMMARFYRLQREGRQSEARELYDRMCVLDDEEEIALQIAAGVLLLASPERPGGPAKPSWPPSPRAIQYEELAEAAEASGAAFHAWVFLGKAIEAAAEAAAPEDLRAVLHCRRAANAIAAGLPGCAAADAMSAARFGNAVEASLPHVRALEVLNRPVEALRVAERALSAETSGGPRAELRGTIERLRTTVSSGRGGRFPHVPSDQAIPTLAELQQSVAKAVHPDPQDSCLFRALMSVAMTWWEEVGGDKQEFAKALARMAVVARDELAALRACKRPRPLSRIRNLWDAHEEELKETGIFVADIPFWPSNLACVLAQACAANLAGSSSGKTRKESATVVGCSAEDHPLFPAWQMCCALAAEVQRAFDLWELRIATELRVSQPRLGSGGATPTDIDCCRSLGPKVDNGDLAPDNRREVSFRIFVPVDGAELGPPATIAIRTKDGELVQSFKICVGRLFAWWSRQAFYQVLGGEAYFSIACWGLIPQKADPRCESQEV